MPNDDVRVSLQVDTELLAELCDRAEHQLGAAVVLIEALTSDADTAPALAVIAELHKLAEQCRVVYEQGLLNAAVDARKRTAGLN